MSEYNLGDRVMYKGVEGVITWRKNGLYEVRLEDSGRWLRADQMEPAREAKGCHYCNDAMALNSVLHSDMTIGIYQDSDDGDYILYACFDDETNSTSYSEAAINYCPMCGRKLEVAE